MTFIGQIWFWIIQVEHAKQLCIFHNEKHGFYMYDIKLVNSLAASEKL